MGGRSFIGKAPASSPKILVRFQSAVHLIEMKLVEENGKSFASYSLATKKGKIDLFELDKKRGNLI
jgi:hypothetical protein